MKKQLQASKAIFAWGLSFAGIALIALTVVKTTSLLVDGEEIPWVVVFANLILSAFLLSGGCLIVKWRSPWRECLYAIIPWLLDGLSLLGVLFLARFLLVLSRKLDGMKAVPWASEIPLVIFGTALVSVWFIRRKEKKTSEKDVRKTM